MKNFLPIYALLLILLSCNNKEAALTVKEDHNVAAAKANEAIAREYYAHFNSYAWEKMAGMYAETSDFKDPSLGTGIVKLTRQQIIDKYAALQKEIPDVHDKIIQIYASGDKHVIVEFVSTGTAPDKSAFELPICTIFTIENGLITKDYTYFDNF